MTAAVRLDLTGFACPMTWVKTRVALDRLAPGARLEVLLARGEPAESVPRTAAEEGHRVIAAAPLPGGAQVSVLIEKGADVTDGAGGEAWR